MPYDRFKDYSPNGYSNKHKRHTFKKGTPRHRAQMEMDVFFSNSEYKDIGASKYKQKQEVYRKHHHAGNLNHELGQNLKMTGIKTYKQYRLTCARYYAYCLEHHGVHDISQLSAKFIRHFLNFLRDKGNTADYICKTPVSALQKLKVMILSAYGIDYDYDKAIRTWIANNYDNLPKGNIKGTYRGFGIEESKKIVAWM